MEVKWVLKITPDTGSNNIRLGLKYCHKFSHRLMWFKQKLDAGALSRLHLGILSFLWHYVSWRELEHINIYKTLVVTYRYPGSSIFSAHNFYVS